MEATDNFLQELTVDGVSPQPIHKKERKLFAAVEKGDLEKVRSVLSFSQPKCNLNSVNSSGKSALQVAGDLENVSIRNEIIQSLLSGGADLELALLHAVRNNNVKIVEILLKFHEQPSQPPPSPGIVNYSKRERNITPLILAACLQNFQIVKLLLEHGFTICDSQTDFQRSIKSNEVVSEKLGLAVFSLNRYRALASPVYMAASFLQNSLSDPDPVHRACVLNKELCDMAEQEYQFRKEYLELSDGCKEFAVALLNECRTMKEIRCVMEMANEGRILPLEGQYLNILEFAIVTRNEKFVSHPYSQLVVNSELYRDVPFLEKSSWNQFWLILMASVLYPLLFMVWLVFDNFYPNHEGARMFHSPCVKFLIHCGSYQTFLFMNILTLFQSTSSFLRYGIVDWVIFLFILGQLVDLIKEIYQQGRVRFFSNNWNYMAVATVMSFILHYVIWWSGRAVLKDKLDSLQWENHAQNRAYVAVLSSECILAVAVLLAFIQNFSFFQANSTIGPLLQAFTQMLLDVTKFYSSLTTTFWSLFGKIDRDSFKIDEEEYAVIWNTGITIFGVFNIVAVLVALNMLIAMLN
ncbi:hypothetical protein OS493_019690 [Desmophyllum pertusum]|uniref:Transient receptor ion channel domain-containing protein n=1 Tax=Desmophyllum pertusum TaxID=174260 RepID=A0A9W9YZI5_9CNID|nr:hypothetical protein OS493_019690 [Desmophyllum pertusum]